MLSEIIYALVIHNNKLSRERQSDMFLTYYIPEFHVADKVLVRNHARDMWDSKYDFTHHVIWVMGQQLEFWMNMVKFMR